MSKEPSNWEEVVEILKNPDLPKGTTLSADYHEQRIRAVICRESHLLNLKMRSDRIIDLWLNTVFAHGGLEGKNKRSDFEATVDQYGHAVFEFCFRSLVRKIGFEFLNISSMAAKPALDFYSQKAGLSPSFRIGAAFGEKRKEQTKEGHLVVREGSSEFFSEETLEEKFTRVLERYENREIQLVSKNLDVSVNELLRAVLNHLSLPQLLVALDGRLEIKALKFGEVIPGEKFRAGWAINRSPINVLDDCVVITDEEGAKALDVALGKFRQQLLKS